MGRLLALATALLAFAIEARSALRQSSSISTGAGGCTPNDASFDFFLLAVQWPPAYGQVVHYFTIHGLWPSRSADETAAASYPCNCAAQESFDVTKLSSVRSRLEKYWPSLMGNPDAEFWEHEYSKHGTCSGFSLLGYFNHTLNLRDLHNPGFALATLVPNNARPYAAGTVADAFRAALGKNVLLGCRTQQGHQVLSELGLSLRKSDLRLMDPPSSVKLVRDELNDCDVSKPIWVLKDVTSFLGVAQ